jgi:hypothetical protein
MKKYFIFWVSLIVIVIISPSVSYCQKVMAFSPSYTEIDADNNKTYFGTKSIIFLDKEEKSVAVVQGETTSDYNLDYIKESEVNGSRVAYWYLKNNSDYDFMAINIYKKYIMFSNKNNSGGRMYEVDKFNTVSKSDIDKLFK